MNFFHRNKVTVSGPPEFIIVGLGNPGKKYEFTRHNSGFIFLDCLSEKYSLKINKIQFKSLSCICDINGHKCLVLKPQTFMNNSGEAVREAASFYKVKPENVIVIFDDISLPCGKMRIRRKGSDGGHNGIKSIIYHLQSDQFPRIKLGVGEKPHPDYNLADWVLSAFTKDEYKDFVQTAERAVDALELMLDGNIDKAMSNFNS